MGYGTTDTALKGQIALPLLLALLAAKVVGADARKAVALAAAVEMLHTATLVHDDLIDGSLRRRGVATCAR